MLCYRFQYQNIFFYMFIYYNFTGGVHVGGWRLGEGGEGEGGRKRAIETTNQEEKCIYFYVLNFIKIIILPSSDQAQPSWLS